MNCSNLCDEEYSNSEAWLAEQIFSQLKNFNTEPLKDDENLQIPPETDLGLFNINGPANLDVLDLGVAQVAEANNELSINQSESSAQEMDISEQQLDESGKKDQLDSHTDQQTSAVQYFDASMVAPERQFQIVECANCNCIFDAHSFPQHVCDYGEDNNLICPEPIENSFMSFQFGPVEPPCIRLLRENQIRIRRFLKVELRYDINAGSTSTKKHDGPHECTLCERKFVHASGLSRHMEKHALDLIPSTSTSPTNGYPSVHGLKVVIKCILCGRIFFEPETAFEHFCLHFSESQENEHEFEGAAEFPYENYLDDAINVLKTESRAQNQKSSSYLKMVILGCVLQCEFCDLLFSEVSYLFAHSAFHHPLRPFECCACEIRVFTSKEIFMHWQTECVFARENLKRGYASQRYYVCNVCENKFASLEQLHEHRYTAYHFFPREDKIQRVLLLPCEYCDQIFETTNDIVSHFEERHYKKNKRNTVSKYRQYLCDICGKTYTQSSHLWQHLRFHQGVKPFACKEPGCSRRFTIRPDLNDHIRKCHTGERPYHCLICGRRFLTGSVFYQHRLIHRGERRYGCEECGKRFYRADALKNHLRIHTGEKPYGCLFCTKNFRQRGDRDKHIRARHSNLDANARLMMQMRKLQLEAAARAKDAAGTPSEDVLMVGNIPFPKSMFQPMLSNIDGGQEECAI